MFECTFIAVETARELQEATSPPSDAVRTVPGRVREMLLGRVGRLGSGARELLAVAAVIGRDFEFDLLRRAADLGERFDFTHDHVWEIVYEEISLVRRSVLHAAIGRAVVHFRAGADQASARGAYREAVRLLR